MKVGFIHDHEPSQHPGGQAYQLQDLMGSAPDWAMPIWCLPGQWDRECDAYVVAGLRNAQKDDMAWLLDPNLNIPMLRTVQRFEDGMPQDAVLKVMEQMHGAVYRSPYHQLLYNQTYRLDIVKAPEFRQVAIPPVIRASEVIMAGEGVVRDLDAMWADADTIQSGPDIAERWADENETHLDLYGIGMVNKVKERWFQSFGQLSRRQDIWMQMAAHKTFVMMPRGAEPFGTAMMEAYAAGCDLMFNGRIGAFSFNEEPDELLAHCEVADQEFWNFAGEVLNA